MSKSYNIVERLRAANERPFITIAEGKTYTVNTSKTTGIHMQAISQDETLDEFGKLDKIIEVTLGKKALKEINEMDLTIGATELIIQAITAALGGEELAEVELRFPDNDIKE